MEQYLRNKKQITNDLVFGITEAIIYLLKSFAEIGVFVCICILCSLSSDFPFESHIIGNFTDYFYTTSNTATLINNKCLCNNTIYNSFCSEKNIGHGCMDVSSDDIIEYKPLLKRHLESLSFCDDMLNSFQRNQGRKLSYIFDFNYNIVRGLSITIVAISLLLDIIFVLFACLKFAPAFKNKRNDIGFKKFFIASQILITLFNIAKFILSLLLYHYIESGDVGKYDEFLDCRFVKRKYFENLIDINKFINKFRTVFLSFAILSIIAESIGKVLDSLEIIKKIKEEKDEIDINNQTDVVTIPK